MTTYLSAQALLANQWQRRACAEVVARDGQYYAGPADRSVIRQAVDYLRQRAERRQARQIADAAREGEVGRIARLLTERRRQREAAARQRWADRVAAGMLGLSTVRREFRRPETQARFLNSVSDMANGAVELIARAVGRIGEQAERDLRELRTWEDFSGKKSRHHRLDRETIDRVQIAPDWSAVLVTIRHYCSFGRSGGDGYNSRGGSSYRVYLIVRDTTTGECHVIRTPPKFGNADTQFFHSFAAQTDWGRRLKLRTADQRRIHAAVAWTFGLKPHKYNPQREA
jgi:hypothetical protein